MNDPHAITRQFESAVAEYCGAPYAVATTSCTMAIFLSLQWHKHDGRLHDAVGCPRRTYVGVPMQIVHSGARIRWWSPEAEMSQDWQDRGWYGLLHTDVIDSARLFTAGMYVEDSLMCTSHHWSKTLGVQQGGMILTDNAEAAAWLRRARFDGRSEGVPVADDKPILGWHAYMSPEVAAQGLVRLSMLPQHNDPLPEHGYPDLSQMDVFKEHSV